MRAWSPSAAVLAVLLTPMLTVPASAQFNVKPAETETKAARSTVAGVGFPDQPLALSTDPLYREFLANVAKDLGRTCTHQETYGWTFAKGDQARLSTIVDATMAAIEKGGYKLQQTKAASIEDPHTVVITGDKAKKRLLIVWAPVSDAVMLMMCDASAATKKQAGG